MYCGLLFNNLISPWSNLKSSTKVLSLVSDIDFLTKTSPIFNLSEPGAAKFVNPLALSYNESSSFALTNSSWILKPTRYEGVFVYGSRTILLAATSTNVPLIK